MNSKIKVARDNLHKLDACVPAIQWLAKQKNIKQAWARIKNVNWIMWLFEQNAVGKAGYFIEAQELVYKTLKECMIKELTKKYPKCRKQIRDYFRLQSDAAADRFAAAWEKADYHNTAASTIGHIADALRDIKEEYCDITLVKRVAQVINDTTLKHNKVVNYIKSKISAAKIYAIISKAAKVDRDSEDYY